ncbi:hypothetical protein TruAng_008291 [Truncatella angustata]|nr:hypothetical protein TruAng_008291 [Truncatella angustata]
MSQQSILVTGATGNQGQGVVRSCLSSTTYKVYALVRDPLRAAAQDLEKRGVVLVKGDLGDSASLAAALEQLKPTTVFLNPPPGSEAAQLSHARNVINAAKAAPSVQIMIYSSASGADRPENFPKDPANPMYEYWITKNEIENLVRSAGFPNWTIVQLGFFMQLFVPPVSNHMFPELWGSNDGRRVIRTAFWPETKLHVIDGGDIGAVVAVALQKPEEFRERTVNLAAEALTTSELAKKIGKARGEKIEVVHETAEDLARKLGPMGPRLVAAQDLFNDIGFSIDIKRNQEEFDLTSVEDFFSKAEV